MLLSRAMAGLPNFTYPLLGLATLERLLDSLHDGQLRSIGSAVLGRTGDCVQGMRAQESGIPSGRTNLPRARR